MNSTRYNLGLVWRVAALCGVLALPLAAAERDLNAELIAAARDGRLEMVEVLLAEGAEVNAKNGNGKTGLMSAAYFGNERVVSLLLAAGADVNAKDNNDSTALIAGAYSGNLNVVLSLLAEGADVNASSKSGASSLKNADTRGYAQISKVLGDAGAGGSGGSGKKSKTSSKTASKKK